MKGTTVNITVVAVYAPKLDAAEEVKDSFYDDLLGAVNRVPAGDMLIGTQAPVPRTGQHGTSWANLQLARGALMVTAW